MRNRLRRNRWASPPKTGRKHDIGHHLERQCATEHRRRIPTGQVVGKQRHRHRTQPRTESARSLAPQTASESRRHATDSPYPCGDYRSRRRKPEKKPGHHTKTRKSPGHPQKPGHPRKIRTPTKKQGKNQDTHEKIQDTHKKIRTPQRKSSVALSHIPRERRCSAIQIGQVSGDRMKHQVFQQDRSSAPSTEPIGKVRSSAASQFGQHTSPRRDKVFCLD